MILLLCFIYFHLSFFNARSKYIALTILELSIKRTSWLQMSRNHLLSDSGVLGLQVCATWVSLCFFLNDLNFCELQKINKENVWETLQPTKYGGNLQKWDKRFTNKLSHNVVLTFLSFYNLKEIKQTAWLKVVECMNRYYFKRMFKYSKIYEKIFQVPLPKGNTNEHHWAITHIYQESNSKMQTKH